MPTFNYKILLTLAILFLILTLGLDYYFFNIPLINDIQPSFSSIYLLRSGLILTSSACLIMAITSSNNSLESQQSELNHTFRVWGETKWSLNKHQFIICRAKLMLFIIALSSSFYTLLFLHNSYAYSLLSYEDGLIETSSAIFTALSGVIFVYLAWQINNKKYQQKITMISSAIFLSGIFFLITLEEISWFQRIFDIPLPSHFELNEQFETNLHNFATDESELIYYIGSFVFLILLPFIYSQHQHWSRISGLTFFIPRPFIIFSSSVFIAYNYDMWNNLFIQFSFFTTLFILSYYLIEHIKNGFEYELISILIALLIAQQLLFIIFGEEFKRLWEVTEYKEFYISLAFLIYSLDTLSAMESGKWKMENNF